MLRAVGSVIAGYVLWSLLWIGMNAVLATVLPETLAPGVPVKGPGILLLLLLWSTVCSLLAGFVAARIAGDRKRMCALSLATLLLATGIAVQSAGAALMPLWFHVTFLVLLAPATLLGAGLGKRRT